MFGSLYRKELWGKVKKDSAQQQPQNRDVGSANFTHITHTQLERCTLLSSWKIQPQEECSLSKLGCSGDWMQGREGSQSCSSACTFGIYARPTGLSQHVCTGKAAEGRQVD